MHLPVACGARWTTLWLLSVLAAGARTASAQLDPSEFFTGSQRRPKLEILYPDNGQVLDDTNLDIQIRVTGYDVPSVFHDSKICVALSAAGDHGYSEHCFDQTPDLVFHAKGLGAGAGYTLRIVFYERGKAIAMSVRSFRVAGIKGVYPAGADDDTTPVTIQTALQIAVQHQTIGMHVEAERIYRNILSENPSHPYALHLLGIIFYQKGQASKAIPYIEQALSAFADKGVNTSTMAARDLDNFHNTLGECFRVLGRTSEAEREFKIALSINPDHYSAEFNLGLTYQQMNKWDRAIERYEAAQALARLHPSAVDRKTMLECKIRHCDLLQAKDEGLQNYYLLSGARACWEEGLAQFPKNNIMHNELGNVLVQLGEIERALDSYRTAQDLGNDLAELNIANVLEILGYVDEARALFNEVAIEMQGKGLSTYHVMIKRALLLPRIMPASQSELSAIRSSMEADINRLMDAAMNPVVTNASPLSFGFSLGYFLAFHGMNSVSIKTKLYRLFSRFCPALRSGFFIEENINLRGLTPIVATEDVGEASVVVPAGCKIADTADRTGASGTEVQSAVASDGAADADISVDQDGFDDASAEALGGPVQPARVEGDSNVVRIGFASRYFSATHSVGLLSIRVIEALSKYNREYASTDTADVTFHVTVYFIAGVQQPEDAVQATVIEAADKIVFLPADLNTCVSVMRRANLNVLIYPEVGIDPVTYFLAYSRLAERQVAWIGHPETTGLASLDYFVTSEYESPECQTRYTETAHTMRGLSTCFPDDYSHLAQELHESPRNVILHRAKFIELLNIPRAAHLYLVAEPLYKLHGQFDEVVSSILLQDKLAYLLILDPANKLSWQQLYVDRMAGKYSGTVRERIVFYVTGGQGAHGDEEKDNVIRAMAAAHVMLDPFPGSGYLQPLRALGIGLPVITMPTAMMAGRLTYAMYSRMKYHDLIVNSPAEYVSLALSIAHKPKLRQQMVVDILSKVDSLYDCHTAVEDWAKFLSRIR